MNHKKKNGKREKTQLESIIYHIQQNTVQGQKIQEEFFKETNEHIIHIDKTAGRNHHYDLVIYTNQQHTYKVEYKGSMKYSNINPRDSPWKTGVQFYNGDPKPFTICREYVKEWYNYLFNTFIIINNYNIDYPIPTFGEYNKDAFRQGKNKLPFMIEFKRQYQQRTNMYSMLEERKEFNKEFAIDRQDLNILKGEIESIYKKIMKDKEMWLQIHGDINNSIDVIDIKWTKGMVLEGDIPDIQTISITTQTPDITFHCNCGDTFGFNVHMRWGYGQGFSNLRIDFK
jgi:hypothetical protein